MIGTSLSRCVRDMVLNDIKVADVEKIVSGTSAEAVEDWQEVFSIYANSTWKGTRRNPLDTSKCVAIATKLLLENKIEQPRLNGEPVEHHKELWIK